MKVWKKKTAWTLLLLTLIGIAWGRPGLSVHAETVTGDEWTTPEAVRVNQTDARALVIPFDDVESARKNPTLRLGKQSPNYIDLDGTWKFNWVSKPSEKPNVEGITSIPEDYFDITVPSSWQTNMQYAGWKGTEIDWPIYNNQDYPWQASGNGVSAQSRGDGSAAPTAYNPVGTYMRTVNIDEEDMGNRFIITFLGVESGYYLYVNGQVVGYDEDSFTTGEFDITEYLHAGENLIAVQVYHYTTGSYLENQDMIYYAGIHRDVYITVQPKVSIYDYNVETTFEKHNYDSGNLNLKVDVTNTSDAEASNYKVRAYLYDAEGQAVAAVNGLEKEVSPGAGDKATAEFDAKVQNPKLWSAELPNLYTLVMELCDAQGNTLQTVGKRIGFREFYIEGTGRSTEMRINGQNIEFYGVNRGEADPRGGHYVPYETIVKDVQSAKQLNINAIRTSHYPPDPNLIELADEYGLYIMDEVNVESHNARTMTIPSSARYENASGRIFPGNDKRYQNAMVDRMTSMVMRDKNNASVLIYSLGNEAGTDATDRLAPDPQEGNFNRMIDVIKKLDGEKLIHYQGWVGNSRVDIDGSMYPDYPTSDAGDKPSIMMEYQHSMGNTGGDFEKYTNAFEGQARRQGGFIWDYVDQSAYTPKDGKGGAGLTSEALYFGFDGSWKQNSGDLNFCVNGFIFPDRTWSPQAYEIKYWYQDLKFTQTEEQKAQKKVTLKNLNRFKNANYYEIAWSILEDGIAIQTGTFTDEEVSLAPPTGSIAAGSTKELTVPYRITDTKEGAEYLLQIEYRLKSDTPYAKKGYVQGSEQFALPEEVKGEDKVVEIQQLPQVQTENGTDVVTVTGITDEGKSFTVQVDKKTGLMTTYRVGGKDLISRAPVGSFFRGETDQNAAINGTNWTSSGEAYDGWYEQGEDMTDVEVKVASVVPQMTKISVNAKLQNGSGYATTYSIYGNATIVVTAKLTPSESAPVQLGEYGMWMQVPEEFENLAWYGRGPSETYWNRKDGSKIGVWEDTTVTEQFVPYLRLQENGNKTDVRWISLRNDEGEGLLASMTYGEGYTGDALEAVALHYRASALSTHRSGSRYPWQAEKTDDVVLRLLTHQKGVGNKTWGTEPADAILYKTDTDLLDYSYTLMPLSADTDPMEKSKEIMGELPEIPSITSISFGDKVVSGFEADKTEYTVELPSDYNGLPVVAAKGPSTLDIAYRQVTEVPGTAVITVSYEDASAGLKSQVEYQIHFQEAGDLVQQLSDLFTIPAMQANTPVIRPEGSKLLYAFSGYGAIYQDQNPDGKALTTGPNSAQATYESGFAGNTEQILDIDISDCNAKSFSGVGGIDWMLKAGNARSTIQFEVWAHKDVSVLTKEYYENTDNIDPGIATRGTADWTASGWVKLAESGEIAGNAANPKYTFTDIPLTYSEGEDTKSYQAIRLVMDVSNGSNSHDQGVWGNPRIISTPDEHPGSGFEEPGKDEICVSVNGVPLEGFDPDTKEYIVNLSYGAKLPEVSATVRENGAGIPVKISEISQLPGDVTISYDNGTPTAYTIHFVKDGAIEGTTAYLCDVVKIPTLKGPAAASSGNLLYAYAGAGTIRQEESEGGAKLKLRRSGRKTEDADDTVIQTYEHGFAGQARQVIDIDISSQRAGCFRADVGIDWAMEPDTGSACADGPTVQFEVWAHKSVSRINYSEMNPSPDGTKGPDQTGWVKLAVSPVMSNWDYSGELKVERNLYSFYVDLTYLDGKETKSYEALRLVMNPVDGSQEADQGIWAEPRVDFIQEEESLMDVPILNDTKIEVTEDGIGVPVLLENINTSMDKPFQIMLAAYDADNRMVGCTVRSYNAKETGGNIDETVTVAYDTEAVGDTTLAFLTWYGEDPFAPAFGVFTRTGNGKFAYAKLPFVNRISQSPQVSLSVNPQKDTVTVSGQGFQPGSALTLQELYEKVSEPDHMAQVNCGLDGSFTYTYTSNFDLEEDSFLDVIVGGQGLEASVTATTKTSPEQGRLPVANLPGAASWNDKVIDLSKVSGLFTVDESAGARKYSVEAGGAGEAVIGEDDKTLTVTAPGTIRIGLVTSQTSTHASAAKVIAVLTVNNNSDRSVLREAISLAEEREPSAYTPESWAGMEEALTLAEEAVENENAGQKELDNATLALLKAICRLVSNEGQETTDKSVLHTALALAGIQDWSAYTAESWASLQTARSQAEETAAKEDPQQQEIEEAVNGLIDALENLVEQLESTYMQDFDESADLPTGWANLQYTSGNLAVKTVSGAPAGYPECVTGNALNASGSGSGTRGARIGYSEKEIPQQAVFDFDFYIKPVSSTIPNLLYLENGLAVKPENSADVKDVTSSFFALSDGMTKSKTLQYYNYDTKAWVDIPGGSGKWLHAQVRVDFAESKVSFAILDGETVLAEVARESALTFASTVKTFNRMTLAAYRGGGNTDCDIWLDNFAITGIFPADPVKVLKVTPGEESITVARGTSLDAVKEELAKLALTARVESGVAPTLTNSQELWKVEGYEAETPGTYQATATVPLPEGYEWGAEASKIVQVAVIVSEDVPEEVTRAIEAIDAIGTVEATQACKERIDAARRAYDDVPEAQKRFVTNAQALLDAEAEYERLAAERFSELSAWITFIESLDEEAYTAQSWAPLETATNAAKALVEEKTATQAQIDRAISDMIAAFGKLEYGVQKQHLQAAVDAAQTILNRAVDYEEDSLAALKSVMEEAKALLADKEATQEEVNQMAGAVIDAIVQVATDAGVASLESLIKAVESLEGSKYTAESKAALDAAVEAAKEVLADADRKEGDLAAAYSNLADALRGLELKGNKAALKAVIDKASEVLENASEYTDSSISGLGGALEKAMGVYEDENAAQGAVNAATEELTRELVKARLKGDVNGDGRVDTKDATSLLKYSAELAELDTGELEGADVNKDGKADTKDAALILQFAAEKIEAF